MDATSDRSNAEGAADVPGPGEPSVPSEPGGVGRRMVDAVGVACGRGDGGRGAGVTLPPVAWFPAGTWKVAPQGHFTRFPACSSGTRSCFSQVGHLMSMLNESEEIISVGSL